MSDNSILKLIEIFTKLEPRLVFSTPFLALAIHFFVKREFVIGFIFLGISLTFLILISPALDILRDAQQKTREGAAKSIIRKTESFYAKFRRFVSRFQKRYYKHLAINLKYNVVDGLPLKKQLDLEEIFVPLTLLPEYLKDVPPSLLSENNVSGKAPEISHYLAREYKKDYGSRIVILGGPGLGKTTLLKHLALSCVSQRRHKEKKLEKKILDLVPVLLYLREIRKDLLSDSQYDLSRLLTVENRQVNPPEGWFREKLQNGQCLVMLDGIDEIPDLSESERVGKWISEQIDKYPYNLFIITSRPKGYERICEKCGLSKRIRLHLGIKPLQDTEIEEFIENWYASSSEGYAPKEDRAVDLIKKINRNNHIHELASNPLLLTMILIVHQKDKELPEGRDALYKEIIDQLLEKRALSRNIKEPLRISGKEKQKVLQKLAFELSSREELSCKFDDCAKIISETLHNISKSIEPNLFIQSIESSSGLLRQQERGVVEFVHRSFQEYLTAIEIREGNYEAFLIDKAGSDWWREIFFIYMSRGDSSVLIEMALEANTRSSIKMARDAYNKNKTSDKHLENIRESLCLFDSPEILNRIDRNKERDKYNRIVWWQQAGRELKEQ